MFGGGLECLSRRSNLCHPKFSRKSAPVAVAVAVLEGYSPSSKFSCSVLSFMLLELIGSSYLEERERERENCGHTVKEKAMRLLNTSRGCLFTLSV